MYIKVGDTKNGFHYDWTFGNDVYQFYVGHHQRENANLLITNANMIEAMFGIEYSVALASGFHNEKRTIDRNMVLIISEIAEVVEAERDERGSIFFTKEGKPEGLASEIIDVMIRSRDTMIDLLGPELAFNIYMLKMLYNMTRPLKHGKKF